MTMQEDMHPRSKIDKLRECREGVSEKCSMPFTQVFPSTSQWERSLDVDWRTFNSHLEACFAIACFNLIRSFPHGWGNTGPALYGSI